MPGLREALEESFDELDAGDEVGGAGNSQTLGEETSPSDQGGAEGTAYVDADGERQGDAAAEDRPRDESGKFVTKPAQDKPASSPAGLVAGQGAATGAVSPGAAPVAAPAYKPPQSWKAGVREKWAALPAEVQAEVIRREKEAATALQARAEAAKGAEGWSNAIRPYEAQIRAAGATPEAYVGDLLKTAHALSYSAEPQKADLMAGLIMQFGITPQALDQALVARMNGQGQRPAPSAQPQEFRDPRLDQFFAQQTAQASAIADETAGGFAESHEFFNDVADTMADILDTWKTRGKTDVTEADLERAYRLACQDNDDVANTLEQRKASAAVTTTQVATQRARAAASSVRTQPTAGASAQPTGRRAALEAAFDELDR